MDPGEKKNERSRAWRECEGMRREWKQTEKKKRKGPCVKFRNSEREQKVTRNTTCIIHNALQSPDACVSQPQHDMAEGQQGALRCVTLHIVQRHALQLLRRH